MPLRLRCFAVLIALGLGACAPAKDGSFPSLQAYENYRQLLRFDLIAAVDQAPAWQRTPDGLRRKLGICTADLALANVGLDRIGGLDTYARDPRKLPLAYRQETLNLEASALAQPAKDGPGVLEPFCKDTAAQLKDYAK
jgi:hypothetical protein